MASAAIGTFTSSRICHGAMASTKPPAVGPIASPTRPTVEIRVIARTRRLSSANSRKASAIDPGGGHRGRDTHHRPDGDQFAPRS